MSYFQLQRIDSRAVAPHLDGAAVKWWDAPNQIIVQNLQTNSRRLHALFMINYWNICNPGIHPSLKLNLKDEYETTVGSLSPCLSLGVCGWVFSPQLADISEIRGFWSFISHHNLCSPHPFYCPPPLLYTLPSFYSLILSSSHACTAGRPTPLWRNGQWADEEQRRVGGRRGKKKRTRRHGGKMREK